MNLADLNQVALAMVHARQGHIIGRRTKSSGTIKKRFDGPSGSNPPRIPAATIGKCCSAPKEAMSKHISGGDFFMTRPIWQNAKDGTPLVKLIEQSGAIPRHQGRRGDARSAEIVRGETGHGRARQGLPKRLEE